MSIPGPLKPLQVADTFTKARAELSCCDDSLRVNSYSITHPTRFQPDAAPWNQCHPLSDDGNLCLQQRQEHYQLDYGRLETEPILQFSSTVRNAPFHIQMSPPCH